MANVNSPILIEWRTDADGKKASIEITNEPHKIVNSQVTLDDLPDEFYKIQVTDRTMYEIDYSQLITSTDKFKCNYASGIVTFHPDLEGQLLHFTYRGKGFAKYPSTRIYDPNTGTDINTVKSLQDYIDSVQAVKFDDVFDVNKVYDANKVVYYNGSTYICKQQTLNHELPTNTLYWTIMAGGFAFKGEFDYTKTYALRDLVNFGVEKSIYECIKPTTAGISPFNAEYWKKRIDTKNIVNIVNDYTNDVTSLYVAHNLGITINHNLNDYPLVHAINISTNTFGHSGFGSGLFSGGSVYQIQTRCEYTDMNNCIVYFDEKFIGTPTITKIDSRNYTITFADDNNAQIKLILK